jgi:hypothetical protein
MESSVLRIEVFQNLTQDGALHAQDLHCAASAYDRRNGCTQAQPATQRSHIGSCKRFAAWPKRSPDTAIADEVSRFQLHLIESGTSICNRNRIMTGVRFLFRVTLRRTDLAAKVWHLKEPEKDLDDTKHEYYRPILGRVIFLGAHRLGGGHDSQKLRSNGRADAAIGGRTCRIIAERAMWQVDCSTMERIHHWPKRGRSNNVTLASYESDTPTSAAPDATFCGDGNWCRPPSQRPRYRRSGYFHLVRIKGKIVSISRGARYSSTENV